MASNAGAAFVELVPKVGSAFERDAESSLRGPLGRVSSGVGSSVGGALKGIVAAAAGALGAVGVGALVKKTADQFSEVGGEIIKFNRLTGLGAEASSKLRFAAKETGTDMDLLGRSVGFLSKRLASNDADLAKLGISYKDAKGNLRPFNDVLLDTADVFSKMPAGVDKNRLALKLFGRSGLDLLPFLNRGRDGLAALGDEAQKFGLVLTEKNLDAIKKNVASQREFHAALEGLQLQLGQYVLPLLTKGTTLFTEFALKGIGVAHRAIEALKPVVADIVDGFSGVDHGLASSSDLFYRIGQLLRTVVTDARDFWSGLIKGTDALGSVQTRFAVFGAQVRAFIEGLRALLSGDTQGFAELLDNAFGNTGRFVGPLRELGNVLVGTFNWFAEHPNVVKGLAEGLAGLFVANKVAGGINAFSGAVGDLLPKLNPVNSELGQLVSNLAKVSGKAFSVTLDIAQAGIGKAGDLASGIAKSVGEAVGKAMSQSLKDQAASAGVSAAIQATADKIATGLAAALGAAFGPAALEAIGTAVVGYILPGIGTAIAGIVGSPVLVVALIAAAVAAAGALIYAFRQPLAEFFTQTLPSFFTDTALPAIVTFFSETLPRALGEAIGTLVAGALTLWVVLPIRLAQLLIEAVPAVVGAALGLAGAVGSAIGSVVLSMVAVVGQAIGAVVNFFVSLPGLVGAALAALPGIVSGVVTAIVGFILRLPAELPGLVATAVGGMISFLSQLPGAVIAFVGSLPGLVAGFLGAIISEVLSWPIVQAVLGVLGQVVEGFRDGWRRVNELTGGALNELVGFFAGLPGRIGGVVTNAFEGLWDAFRSVWDRIASWWNSIRLGFDIPSLDLGFLGKIGGGRFEIGVPRVPVLDLGGTVMAGGLAVIDRYHELVNLPSGATVEPLGDSAMLRNGSYVVEVPVYIDGREVARASAPFDAEAARTHRRSRSGW